MADLTAIEKRKLERALGMGGGYVLNFSNRTFAEFFLDCCDTDIDDDKYEFGGTSKANRMRAFWKLECNSLVGQLLDSIFSNWEEFKPYDAPDEPPSECLCIVKRLNESVPVPDIDMVEPNCDGRSFDILARSVRDSIDKNEPEVGLDRLHTFVVRYFRVLCQNRGLQTPKDKPLHSLVGEYVKALKQEGALESAMSERILRSSISVMDSFNHVRNEMSYAHANDILNYDESLLIFAHVTATIRFINSIESESREVNTETTDELDDIPF